MTETAILVTVALAGVALGLSIAPKNTTRRDRTEDPKNCQFCKQPSRVRNNGMLWWVECAEDECLISGPVRSDTQGAIAAWNRIEAR